MAYHNLEKMILRKGKTSSKANFFLACGKPISPGVLIRFYGTKKVEHIRKISQNLGRILLVEVEFVLINNYKVNTEPAQLQIFSQLCSILDSMEMLKTKYSQRRF